MVIRDGDAWRHKRHPEREVYLRHVGTWMHDGRIHIGADRNTSRRTQAISVTALLRDYKLQSRGSGVVLIDTGEGS